MLPRMRLCANCGTKYPQGAPRCPECSTHTNGEAKAVDPICAYDDHGVKCKHYGTLSPSTTGSGPWYCRDHAWVFLYDRKQPEKQTTWPTIKSELDGLLGKRKS